MGLPHRYTQVMSVQLNTQSSLSWYMCPYGLEMQARLFLRDFLHQGSNTQSVCIGASVFPSPPSLPTHPITFSALRPGGSLLESAPLSPLSTGFPLALVFGRQQLTAGAERGIWVDPCLSCSTLGCLPLAAAGSLYDSGSLQADPSPWLPLSLGFCWAISTPSTLGGDGNDNAHPCWALGATASSVCLLIPSTALDSFPWKHLSWILCPARMLACTATVVSFTVGHDNLVQCTRLSFVSVLYPRSIRPMWTHHEYGDVSLFTIQ